MGSVYQVALPYIPFFLALLLTPVPQQINIFADLPQRSFAFFHVVPLLFRWASSGTDLASCIFPLFFVDDFKGQFDLSASTVASFVSAADLSRLVSYADCFATRGLVTLVTTGAWASLTRARGPTIWDATSPQTGVSPAAYYEEEPDCQSPLLRFHGIGFPSPS